MGHKISTSSNNGVTTYTCSACKLSYKVTFEGNGTTQSPYLIANKEDLFCLAGLMNNPQTAELFRTKSYKQTENIDLTNKKWTPMGKFKINGKDTVCYFEKGFVYDGNNHSIFNMNINETSGYSGFIGKVNYGTVKNLAVYGCVSSTTETGEGTAGIVGEVAYMGKVLNCSFNGNVSSDESSGGIVGHVWRGATIENCYHNGTVIGGKWAGGIVGLALDKNYESEIHTNINNCYHVGNVTGPEAGGILGRHSETGTLNKNNTLNINNCYYHKTSAKNGLGVGTFTKNVSTPLISIMLKEAAIDLGNSFGSNDNEAINNSYPVFNWQLPSKVKGDINNDGKLQIADVVKLQKALSKVKTLAVSEAITSDVNGDGKDRSFTFAIDKLDKDETAQQLHAATTLERQTWEVVIPEIDSYVYGVMCENAGTKAEAKALTKTNIYTEILAGNQVLDDSDVPETGRVLMVTPAVYTVMKQCADITMETDIGNDMRIKGVIGMLDGCTVIKVPSARLPENFGFMLCHPCATVAPIKLEDYKIHEDPPGISGSLVEGRINYDAFVLENKAMAIYYHAIG